MKVLSFNCWDMKVASKDRKERVIAIARQIKELQPDLVALQEVFVREDREKIAREAAKVGIEHVHYFRSGLGGSGLLILNRFPIIRLDFVRYRLNGKPHKPLHGDYYAGKGMGLAWLDTPSRPLLFCNTHLIARYAHSSAHGSGAIDEYYFHRLSQVYQIISSIQKESSNVPVILAGDLNIGPTEIAYQLLVASTGLTDSFQELNENDTGHTASEGNMYQAGPSQRIDYVFCRGTPSVSLTASRSKVVMKERFSGRNGRLLNLSDHFGVLSEVFLRRNQTPSGENGEPSELTTKKKALTEFDRTFRKGLDEATSRFYVGLLHVVFGTCAVILAAVATVRSSRIGTLTKRRWRRLVLKIATITLIIYALAASWYTFGYTRSEIAALRAFTSEVQHALHDQP